ncbi:outer membrane beta-barrel protein [Dyella marensis]|jgi:hypothetical protein|uniref:Outer membrane protein beta-barrel domain-containing protein n=1 Tax=Dyella marensis TaxID=500610 RepID=A0A1I1ZQZ5_9GAMM|nr:MULTISPECIES: outer membrane beta-barrel protein [Dyella]SFE34085.1 Outer membrane protein beta-barrel domain-containing protein [Dyella marensis]
MNERNRRTNARIAAKLSTAVLLACGSGAAAAQQSPALDNVSVWLGGFYANTDTKISANDRNNLVRGSVNLEDDLGFPDHKLSPRARVDVLLGEHQGFSFDYYTINREESRYLSRDINYRGVTYGASAKVSGKLNFDFGSAAYHWWFGNGNSVFGVGVGAAYYGVSTRISGEATALGQTAQATAKSDDNAWAPMLQLGWRYAVSDQLRVYVDASGVKKNGRKLGGHIYNGAVGVEWFPWKNVGLGAEYGYTKIKVKQGHNAYDDQLDMKVNGPSLFLRLRF